MSFLHFECDPKVLIRILIETQGKTGEQSSCALLGKTHATWASPLLPWFYQVIRIFTPRLPLRCSAHQSRSSLYGRHLPVAGRSHIYSATAGLAASLQSVTGPTTKADCWLLPHGLLRKLRLLAHRGQHGRSCHTTFRTLLQNTYLIGLCRTHRDDEPSPVPQPR